MSSLFSKTKGLPMSQDDNGSGAAMTAVSNGRPIKFTPERLEQIRNLGVG
jgi:hypothetical protein